MSINHKQSKYWTDRYDEDGLLHSDKGAATVETFPLFMGGIPPMRHYFIHGQEFTLHRWYDIVEKTISLRIVLSLPIAQRQAIVKYVGLEKLFYNSKPNLVSKTKQGNELFRIRIRGTRGGLEPYSYWLRYKCPSTGKIYISGIPPDFIVRSLTSRGLQTIKDHYPWLGDLAMAWKLGLLIEEYCNITEEA